MSLSKYNENIPKINYYATFDTNFVAGSSPVTLNINSTLGENATNGTITNDGAGDFSVELSQNGSTFGNSILMKNGETFSLENLSIHSIRITWIADSAYRVFAT